ncbi:Ketoacyl-synthetase C-terminal extension [Chitinophaga sp. CF118]|uniref:beta-ketoacyl synthase N-terminal-like domain-containing protein n=1 Tax=Chitinophaga sp. CF118 TaxID=1884367 RepID=UPI0008F0A72B|nr:beta-ketoacyl synthase N-terminal-like domain-containing protein [Chitinophaga sp. CF118]SFD49911.1 Ketoacyl-synthetase C-terminal extension [Chitinophaga sp. CF118]
MREKIAIIGLSALFPENKTAEEFWECILNNQSLTSKPTEKEFRKDTDYFYDAEKNTNDKTYCLNGAFLRDFKFNPEGFKIDKDELTYLDETYQWVLSTGRDALEKAGYWNKSPLESCGLIVGSLSSPTRTSRSILNELYTDISENVIKSIYNVDSFSLPRINEPHLWSFYNAFSAENLSALTSKALGLGRRHFALDAACSSSLHAIEIASYYLNTRKADMMLAGAISSADPLFANIGFSHFNAFPSQGRKSKPFDKSSSGLTPGEGASFVLLKRYEDALRDGDEILSVIYSTGISNDGAGKFILSPNKKGQIACFERAYSHVNISPEDICYIECHGTGTAVGDATEMESIKEFFGEASSPYLGTVKSNTGHLLTAGGMAGLVKVINSLNSDIIPATIGIENPVDLKEKIVTRNIAWPKESLRLAAINSFGFGGANAHLILGAGSTANEIEIFEKLQPAGRIAITGMDVCLGEITSLQQLNEVITTNTIIKKRLPQNRWYGIEELQELLLRFNLKEVPEGNFVDAFDFDILRYKIPPREASKIVTQQLLLLKTADKAIQQSGLQKGGKIGVIIAMQSEQALHRYAGRLDLNWQFNEASESQHVSKQQLVNVQESIKDFINDIVLEEPSISIHTGIVGSIMASRVAALWDFTGPAFTVSCGEDSFTKVLDIAKLLIEAGTCDGVVAGAVDLAGGYEHILLRSKFESTDYPIGEGAAAFVLQNENMVESPEKRVLGYLNDVVIEENKKQSFSEEAKRFKDVSYLEFSGSSIYNNDFVKNVIRDLKPLKSGSVTPNVGYTYAASVAASFAKALIQLNNHPANAKDQVIIASLNNHSETNGLISVSAGKAPIFLDGNEATGNKTASLKKIVNGGGRLADHFSVINNQQLLIAGNNNNSKTHNEVYSFEEACAGKLPTHKMNNEGVIWDENDLLNFAGGCISEVFGDNYKIIDSYKRKVRLPLPPYLLVSRVTSINAKTGEFKPSTMTTEYDIPYNAWYSVDGQIPWAVSVESGQCDLMLISYLGIDFENKGERVYRLLDCTLTFLDELPKEGDTLRYDISINSFVRNGDNLLFFFSYNCYVGEKTVLRMTNGSAGFFSDEELEQGQGVVKSKKELELRSNIKRRRFVPIKNTSKNAFTRQDLLHLVNGKPELCFGESYHHQWRNPSLRLPSEHLLMLDRITEVDPEGGPWSLGLITAEKDLHPEDWYFLCHFKDDEVLAGSLQAEGGGQLLQFFMLYLGMHGLVKDARFQPIEGLPQKVRCRKQVTPKNTKLIYRMEIKEISLTPDLRVISDVEILTEDGLVAVHFENLGLRLKEKNNSQLITAKNSNSAIPLLNEEQLANYALGSLVKFFGSEFEPFENRVLSRLPNTDLQFVSRIMSFSGQRHNFNNKPSIVGEYDVPLTPWYYNESSSPVIPYSILMEIALQPCGVLTAYLGSAFIYPDKDMFFRNLDGEGTLIENMDLRGKTIINKAVLISNTVYEGNIIQKFTFEMVCNGKVFYKGTAAFGWFPKSSLVNQVGLDRGEEIPSWFQTMPKTADILHIDLASEVGLQLFRIQNGKKHFRLTKPQLNFLDKLTYVTNGGTHGKGYIYGFKEIDPADWFYNCHFYLDPIMPGSLGVEAMIQAMQAFSILGNLGNKYANPCFKQLGNHQTMWKYRGQIMPDNKCMSLEIHIISITENNNQTVIMGEGSLWKENIRIYEIKNLAFVIEEAN